MPEPISQIVIVGGGTAGWLSAVYLATYLDEDQPLGRPQITLVESSEIGILGVGESTLPTLQRSLAFLGIDETDWMLRCNSTFKICVRFENWNLPGGDGATKGFWNPVESLRVIGDHPISAYWLKRHLAGSPERFDYACFATPHLADARRVPKVPGNSSFDLSYHVDAGLLAHYLREVAIARGVRHIDDRVVDVALDAEGSIDRVVTRDHGPLAAELFLDCSGFRGLLLNQTLNEPFLSYSDQLFCDRAIAIPAPRGPEDVGLDPFTTATARDAGWVWNVPLVSRDGTGYVYSSAFLDDQQAERELRDFLGPRAVGVEARHLRMRVGRSRCSWVKNCVAIGLSSGFVEPLEATGIYFVEHGLQTLLRHWPDQSLDPATIAAFNDIVGRTYDEVRDFIVLHYYANDREDTAFWRATKHDVKLSDSLLERMRRFESRLPEREMFQRPPFREATYTCILLGMEYWRERGLPSVDEIDADLAARVMEDQEAAATALRILAPDHHRFLLEASGRRRLDATSSQTGSAAWW